MLQVLLVVQIFIAVFMIGIILIQRNASDSLAGLGGGSGGGMDSLLSSRASANLMTRATAILAAAFMINCLIMAAITARQHTRADSILEAVESESSPSIPLGEDDISIEEDNTVELPSTLEPANPDAVEERPLGDAESNGSVEETDSSEINAIEAQEGETPVKETDKQTTNDSLSVPIGE